MRMLGFTHHMTCGSAQKMRHTRLPNPLEFIFLHARRFPLSLEYPDKRPSRPINATTERDDQSNAI